MKMQLLILLFLLGLSGFCLSSNGQGSVVLVTASDTDFPPISRKELRRLYLGLVLVKGSIYISPVINKKDPDVLKGFLQNVMFMSERNYKRQIVERVFRSGGEMPKEFGNTEELREYLRKYQGSVTFMYEREAVTDNHLRIVSTLW